MLFLGGEVVQYTSDDLIGIYGLVAGANNALLLDSGVSTNFLSLELQNKIG